MAKSTPFQGLDFLLHPAKRAVERVCAVYGDETYLKREVIATIRRQVLGEDDGEFSLTTLTGGETELHAVFDALATVSLFGGSQRLVVVEGADPFVSRYRSELEKYAAKPAKGGVLVLEVKTWPGNTRLAKVVAKEGLAIECKSPKPAQTKRWLCERAKSLHGVTLDSGAADMLIELLPQELGILEQEVAKLALLAGNHGGIHEKLVREHVGGWRTRKTWDMIDAAAEGQAQSALDQLDRLLSAGEQPIGLLAQLSSTLRRFVASVRLIEQGKGLPLRTALQQAGTPPFKLADAERQLRQIGRERAKQLGPWLLTADLAMKGHNSTPPRARLELERLIVRLSSAASDQPARR